MEGKPHDEDQAMGEDSGEDIRRPFALHANKVVKSNSESNVYLSLGPEHGEVKAARLRFREALEEGHLRMYIRKEAGEHKVITFTSTVIALGIVIAGINRLKHRKD